MGDKADAVRLARQLVSYVTVNPPGNEAPCAAFLRNMLEEAGFTVSAFEFAPDRTSLLARIGDPDAGCSLCFVGHLDTVPLGTQPWRYPPFSAEIVDGKLYGRGACDMKSGVAAFVTAAIAAAPSLPSGTALVLLLVAGEETGCEGSTHLMAQGIELGTMRGVIVAEPTGNYPLLGHKGALWLKINASGISAHGATPEKGVNAVRKAAEIVRLLDHFCDHHPRHPVLGGPTVNIGYLHGGSSINLVPDLATVAVDMRTTPENNHAFLRERLDAFLHPYADSIHVQASIESIFTCMDDDWVRSVFTIIKQITGCSESARTANYFTDASALKSTVGNTPILILGPGEPAQMHQTDEYCDIGQIEDAVRIYTKIIDDTFSQAGSYSGKLDLGAEAS